MIRLNRKRIPNIPWDRIHMCPLHTCRIYKWKSVKLKKWKSFAERARRATLFVYGVVSHSFLPPLPHSLSSNNISLAFALSSLGGAYSRHRSSGITTTFQSLLDEGCCDCACVCLTRLNERYGSEREDIDWLLTSDRSALGVSESAWCLHWYISYSILCCWARWSTIDWIHWLP